MGNSRARQPQDGTLMYAAHFAAGLAIGSQTREAPMWALLGGAFLPDILWTGLSAAGLEPAAPATFFDDWSHSFLSVMLLGGLFALCFVQRGARVWVPVWAAVASHFVLDAVIHPKPIALYPRAALHVPWDLWRWGSLRGPFGFTHYWWVQFGIVVPLLTVYAKGALRDRFPPNLIAATILTVAGLELIL